jgi:acyl-lipid omega-6 desaturase (Delta-12 desaturase)
MDIAAGRALSSAAAEMDKLSGPQMHTATMNSPHTPPAISKTQLLRELATYAKPSNKSGVTVFLRDYALYWGLLSAVLFAPSLGWKILASVLLGVRMTSMYTLAHDASHRTLCANRRLNWIIALLLGIPTVQNYRMWTHDHNHVHHPRTNGDHFDFYRPFSKQEYDALSKPQQFMERLYRAPNVIGLFLYFLLRWIPTRVYPNPRTPRDQVGLSLRYSALLLGFHAALVFALYAVAPQFAPVTAAAAVLLGWVVPLGIHFLISSASLYLMHTHPNIPWFKGDMARSGDRAPELCSTAFTVPDWFSKMVNNVYCHAAHHAHHGIPSYNLLKAQKHMNRLMGNRLVTEPLTFGGVFATLSACKLYDFDNHQWLDFNGVPTARRIDLSARGAITGAASLLCGKAKPIGPAALG